MSDPNHGRLTIAIVGLRDNGKSTLINALLGDEVTEASEEDCTRGVQNFNLRLEPDASICSSRRKENLEEIKRYNSLSNEEDISKSERSFDLPVTETLVPLHHGLDQITIKDFPGFNRSPQYKETLRDSDYDMIIVVVDSQVALRDEFGDQQKMLEDVRKHTKFDTGNEDCPPIIIAINKVDATCDCEVSKRLQKVFGTIETVFKVSNRKESLRQFLDDHDNKDDVKKLPVGTFPIVVPISAKNAFLYRLCANLSYEEFSTREEMVDKIAKEVLGGSEARKLSKEEKYKKTFQLTRSRSQDSVAELKASGYAKLQQVINICLAGKTRQGYLICQKLRREQMKIQEDIDPGYTKRFFKNVKQQQQVLDSQDDGEINFSNYKEFLVKHKAIVKKAFQNDPTCSSMMVDMMSEINTFHENSHLLYSSKNTGRLLDSNFAVKVENWKKDTILDIFRLQLNTIVETFDEYCQRDMKCSAQPPEMPPKTWQDMTVGDWILNLESVKLHLDHSELKNFAFQRKNIHRILIHLNGLWYQNHGTMVMMKEKGIALENHHDLSWDQVGNELHVCLEKLNKRKLQHDIAIAAQETIEKHFASLNKRLHSIDEGIMEVKKRLKLTTEPEQEADPVEVDADSFNHTNA